MNNASRSDEDAHDLDHEASAALLMLNRESRRSIDGQATGANIHLQDTDTVEVQEGGIKKASMSVKDLLNS